MIDKQELLAALREVQDGKDIVFRHGICMNAAIALGWRETGYFEEIMCELLSSYFKSWPEFSGSSSFPVQETEGQNYVNTSNVWHGPYGEARKRLLAHCIAEIEKELAHV